MGRRVVEMADTLFATFKVGRRFRCFMAFDLAKLQSDALRVLHMRRWPKGARNPRAGVGAKWGAARARSDGIIPASTTSPGRHGGWSGHTAETGCPGCRAAMHVIGVRNYRLRQAELDAANGGYVINGYGELFRRYLFRGKESAVHPFAGRGFPQ
jgi:hypothetical protein